MKKFGIFACLTAFSLLLGGCSLPTFPQAQSGLLVEGNPQAQVFIEGKEVGTTPYEDKKLTPGEIAVRLVPQASGSGLLASWEGKIRLTPGIQTIISRNFTETLASSSGYLLSFDKLGGSSAALSVVSVPDAAGVKVDGQYQGFTPVALQSLSPGDHQVLLSAPGYVDQLIGAKAIAGYRLIVSAQLAQLPSPAGASSSSAAPAPSSTPAPPGSSPAPSPQPSFPPKPYVLIQDTPTGWLRVRTDPSTSASEAAKVNPGQSFPYKDTSSDGNWYQIEYQAGSLGWVSAQYAKKVE